MAGSVDETPAGGHTAQDTDQTHDEAQNSTAGDPSASEAVTAAVEALGELATLTPPLIDDGSEGSDYELDDFDQIGVGELLLLQANLQHLKQKMRGEVQFAAPRALVPPSPLSVCSRLAGGAGASRHFQASAARTSPGGLGQSAESAAMRG